MRRHDERPHAIRGVACGSTDGARELRRRETPAECALWQALRGRRLDGLKFRRQHAVGPYVLDFWCPEANIVVELDGDIHDAEDRAAYDADRTDQLEAHGYRVIRFRNEHVLTNLDFVLHQISAACKPQTPPLPKLGEGAGG